MLAQDPECAIAHVGCWKAGIISSPCSVLFASDAIKYRLNDCKTKILITDEANYQKVSDIKKDCLNLEHIILTDTSTNVAGNFWKLIEDQSTSFTNVVTKSEDVAWISYTSGTTGMPKGSVQPHRMMLGHMPSLEFIYDFFPKKRDALWSPADWAWIGGLFDILMPSLFFGIPVISHRDSKFDPEFAFSLMEKFEVKNTFLPPTALKIMKSFNENKKRPNLRLRTVGSGGEALGEELLHWGKEILNVGINEFYGQTECNLTVSNNGSIMKQKLSSIGRPVPGHDVKLKNNEGNFITEENKEGEIVVEANSPSIFLGYWGNEKETNNKIINGWLHTGDYATFDNEGYFYFKGRKDDIINTSGYRVGPTEIENSILSLNEVEMVAVIGVSDEVRGKIIKAIVVPKDKSIIKSGSIELKKRIKEHVKNNLAAYEYPRLIEFKKGLPLTTTGKIKRNILRKDHLEEKYERKI